MDNEPQIADLQDDLTLKLWEGDDSAKADLLMKWSGCIEKAMHNLFPTLTIEDVEDVVCEAIRRFWLWRESYDPELSSIGSRLYWFARNVASELRSGRLKWQKERNKEVGVDSDFFAQVETFGPINDLNDDVGGGQSSIHKALRGCYEALSELQQDIVRAYGDAGSYELNAVELGIELGNRHKNGIPIPAGTIRTNKSRAWASIKNCMKKKNIDLSAKGYTND